MKTSLPQLLSGDGIELFVVDDNVLLTYNRNIPDFHEAPSFITNQIKDFAFSCPKRKAAYKAMAGDNETAMAIQCAKCMFANLDGVPDITSDGKINPEYVECGKRHYCEHVGIGCLPTLTTANLSKREASLIPHLNLTNNEIADKLFISTHTVKSHIKNISKKINIARKGQIYQWANDNGLIN